MPGEAVLGERYQLVREIARGGMAAVWEAEDTLLGRRVAVKRLHPQFANEPEFLERFRREARAAASLAHPNIVPIYDVGEDRETATPYIVMELVRGENLKSRIRRAPPPGHLSDDEVRQVGAAIAVALDYAHRHGIIHRDVKPQNVLLGEDGRPRLTDFGIAQALATSALTRTGAVMGSVHYLAPELARGQPATPRSDIYSLGVVLYEMATGRAPFSGETELSVALAHVEQPPATPRTFNAGLAPDLEATILQALAKAPEARLGSAASLAAALTGDAEATQRLLSPAGAGASDRRSALPPDARRAAPASRSQVAPPARARAAPAVRQPAPVARARVAPKPRRSSGPGLLGLLLLLAALLVALGAGFFGLASLSREGLSPPAPSPAPTQPPTAPAKPAIAPTATPPPTATAVPPTATAVPATATPAPPTATPRPAATATPRAATVPNLRGMTLNDALSAIQTAGLTVTVRGVNVDGELNTVIDQNPAAGASVPPGTTISLSVATGNVPVPNVVGMPREQAQRVLQEQSFRLAPSTIRRDPRLPQGAVIETRPGAGSVVPRGTAVELVISTGP